MPSKELNENAYAELALVRSIVTKNILEIKKIATDLKLEIAKEPELTNKLHKYESLDAIVDIANRLL